jgi:multicomponent Na+:H+ antiporter subunit D
VLAQIQLLLFATLSVVFLMRTGLYPPEVPGVNIDAEWLYRRLLPRLATGALAGGRALRAAALTRVGRLAWHLRRGVYRLHGPDGTLAGNWRTGNMAFWTTLILGAFLLLAYL